jgi:hypothetical protein
MDQPATFQGSCLCGEITYEVAGPLAGPVLHCHCSMCRKATGAAFRTRVSVPTAALRWLCGEALLGRYPSSPDETRSFCILCGATFVTFFRGQPDRLGLALGTLDDDPRVRPAAHVYVGSKAAWFEISDDLPQFVEALPPDFGR